MAISELPFTVTALHQAYAAGVLPQAVVAECFRRIAAAADPGIFIELADEDAALHEASRLGAFDPVSRPLWGIPFAVKDNIDTSGMPTTAACPEFAYVARKDAYAVAKLRDAGAILIGKTNLDQFATGLVGLRTPYPVPVNPIDPQIVPGGSSSGSAVAVARGLVSFALGTDTAGSGRVPAALNNIVGLKPTLGAISATGVVPACRTLDTISVFALTVDDAYRAFRSAVSFDPADAYARPVPVPALSGLPVHCRIGVPDEKTREFFGDTAQAKSFRDTLTMITALGGDIVEIDFTPFFEIARMLYDGAWVAERYAAVETFMRDKPDAVHPVTRGIIARAEGLSAADAFRGQYRLEELKREVQPHLKSVDFLCVPTIPAFFTVSDLEADPVGPNTRLGTYTNFVNLLDLCGIAVPVTKRSDGRPGSVTILAAAGRDGQAASFAAELQRRAGVPLGATGWPFVGTDMPPPCTAPDEIALAAVGAHMSGLPLNGELTRLGGRFVKQARTAPNYRLYSLAGGPPLRPGLMREAGGASIDLEIWALPSQSFGEFLRGIPAPLGIGTVMLEDGATVNGFICEAAGLERAVDITEYGGWRRYLETGQSPAA